MSVFALAVAIGIVGDVIVARAQFGIIINVQHAEVSQHGIFMLINVHVRFRIKHLIIQGTSAYIAPVVNIGLSQDKDVLHVLQ